EEEHGGGEGREGGGVDTSGDRESRRYQRRRVRVAPPADELDRDAERHEVRQDEERSRREPAVAFSEPSGAIREGDDGRDGARSGRPRPRDPRRAPAGRPPPAAGRPAPAGAGAADQGRDHRGLGPESRRDSGLAESAPARSGAAKGPAPAAPHLAARDQ